MRLIFMKKVKWLVWLVCLFFSMSILVGCGSFQGKAVVSVDTNSQKSQESTIDSNTKDKNVRQLLALCNLIGKNDEELQEEMKGEGQNEQKNQEGTIQSRDYIVRLFGYNITAMIALENEKVSSCYLYLGGENYDQWKDQLTNVLGDPVQDQDEDENDMRFCTYNISGFFVTLTSTYDMQYITITSTDVTQNLD